MHYSILHRSSSMVSYPYDSAQHLALLICVDISSLISDFSSKFPMGGGQSFVFALLTIYCSFSKFASIGYGAEVLNTSSNTAQNGKKDFSTTATPPIVYILDVFTYYANVATTDTAINIFRQRFPQLLQKYEFEVVRKNSNRVVDGARGEQADPQLSLQVTVRSLNYDNRTYVYIAGPSGGGEGKTIGLMTPIYNMVTVSGTTTADVLSDIKAYPLHATFCSRNSDYAVAQKVFVRLLKFDRIASVLLDEFSVDRLRNVEKMLVNEQTRIVAWHMLSRERVENVAQDLRSAEPYGIITEFGGRRGAQAICRLFKNGIFAQDVVWIIGGPFERVDWWEPLPGQPGWLCTRNEMLAALNGSLAIEAYAEPNYQTPSEVNRRVDKLDNAQLGKLMLTARTKYPDSEKEELNVRWFYVYDATIAGLLAFYRGAEKFEKRFNYTVNALKDYASPEFEVWGKLMMAELLNTSFYGATGHVSLTPDRHSGQATIQVSQFQSFADTGQHKWVVVGKTDTAANTSQVWPERLVFGTLTGEPPHVIRARNAAFRDHNIAIAVACGVVGAFCLAVCLGWCLVRRIRQAAWRDVSWVIADDRIVYSDAVGRLSRSSSIATTVSGSSTFTFTSMVDTLRVAMLDGTHQVWIRQLRSSTRVPLTSITPVKLNKELFPLARAMSGTLHENVNRFFGITNSQDRKDLIVNAVFALQPKGSVRHLLLEEKFSVEEEMKLLFLTDMVQGLMVLHDAVGPHGFLNPDNLLIDERYTVKVTDYGLVQFQPLMSLMPATANTEFMYEDVIVEKLVFRAPELLRHGFPMQTKVEQQEVHFTTKCDVYSLGMIFVEVMTRQLPFAYMFQTDDGKEPSKSANDLLDEIITGTLPPTRPLFPGSAVNASLSDLIKLCWHENATYRPSPAQVLRLLKRLPGYKAGNVMQNLVKRLENFAQNLQKVVEERTQALVDEMQKTEQLLLQILPRSVAEELKKGKQVLPETFESVSIYFSDIVGFTTFSSESSPMEIVTLLNKLYTTFDSIISRFDVYKVETIGDAYMVASGVPERNDQQHCAEVARMSLRLLREILTFEVPHRQAERLALRIGLHCGPCVAGVVGLKMPRYCLFGDTVNTASRMESNGVALKIHTSESFYKLATESEPLRFAFQERGRLEIKGKGSMITYWLLDETMQFD